MRSVSFNFWLVPFCMPRPGGGDDLRFYFCVVSLSFVWITGSTIGCRGGGGSFGSGSPSGIVTIGTLGAVSAGSGPGGGGGAVTWTGLTGGLTYG